MGYEQAVRILQRLEEHGFEAYFVGGCVRDWLLGRTVHDIDICTNAHPGDVISLFPDHVPTGLKHGTVSVKMEGKLFEVTTFRTEGKYEDYRRPKDVRFVSDLKLDLQRRDFTINAIAMDLRKNLHDPFHGRQDLAARLIRAVGDPGERFREDALRLLRAARFAAQLNFRIEGRTLAAMQEAAPLLGRIAVERVREELNKMLDSAYPQRGFEIVRETHLLCALPWLSELFANACAESWRLIHLRTLAQKWALFFFAARCSAAEARMVCEQLRMSKRDTNEIGLFVECLQELKPQWDKPEKIGWGKLLVQRGFDVCANLDTLLQACWWRQRDGRSTRELERTYREMPVKTEKELAVNGRDLQKALDKQPGEWIARVLKHLLEQTALHGLPNEREILMEAARNEVMRNEY